MIKESLAFKMFKNNKNNKKKEENYEKYYKKRKAKHTVTMFLRTSSKGKPEK